jgi:hypothetical protein
MIGYRSVTGVDRTASTAGVGGHTIGVPMDDGVHGGPVRREDPHRWHKRAETPDPLHGRRPHPNGSEECLVIRGPEPLDPRANSAEEALPPAREQLPLPRRRQQAHLEPQLRERRGAGEGTPFSAFTTPAAPGTPTAPRNEPPRPAVPEPRSGGADGPTAPFPLPRANGLPVVGTDGANITDEPADAAPGEPKPPTSRPERVAAERAAAFRAATRRGRRPDGARRPRGTRG